MCGGKGPAQLGSWVVRPLATRMVIKTRTFAILATLLFVFGVVLGGGIMSAKWKLAAFLKVAKTIHNYHGICNSGVGDPYADFVHQLRGIAESGDTNKLVTILRRADERSRDIYEVWLGDGYENDIYRRSIHEILK